MNDVWRLLFTSWNFFDHPGQQFRTRLILNCGTQLERQRIWPEPVSRKWWRIFFNPSGNDYHYSKQLESRAALLSQKLRSKPQMLIKTRAFRKYLDHVSASVGPKNFVTMKLNLETKSDDQSNFETLLSLTLPIAKKVSQ